MSYIHQLVHKLKKWKDIQSKNIVHDLLLNAQAIEKDQSEQNIDVLLTALNSFHKEINKSNNQLIDEDWFKEVQKAKNNIKKIIEDKKKDRNKPPQLIKSSSHIQYPTQLVEQRREQDKVFARTLYKNFLLNLPENILERKEEIIAFISNVIDVLYEEFQISKDKNWVPEEKSKLMGRRIDKINDHFKKRETARAKEDMLEGLISYRKVSELDPDAFISEKTKKAEQQRLMAMARENETGFYDQMKKDINKNASEQCRYCRKNTAYCEGQKQIRAADQPMTRFMLCNSCGKRWRQQ